MKRSRMSTGILAAVVIAVAAPRGPGLLGHGMLPQQTPIERILANLTERLKARPDDASLHYRFGRAHALALEFKMQAVFVWPRQDGDPEVVDRCWTRQALEVRELLERGKRTQSSPPTEQQLREHLTEAVRHLNRAIELDPTAPHIHLALASALEAGAPLADGAGVFPRCPVSGAGADGKRSQWIEDALADGQTDSDAMRELRWTLRQGSVPSASAVPSPRDLAVTALHGLLSHADVKLRETARKLLLEDWKESIAEEYFIAFSLALPFDSRRAEKPIWGSMESWATYEAAKGYLVAVEARGAREDDKVRVEVARAAVKAFDDLPHPRAITPIIFPGAGSTTLASCLAPATHVCFDLDGTGRDRAWPWVRPETGILVWDPGRTGRIGSGQQLFGSVTWWLFFADGYEALSSLDDDGDGELDEAELHGIGVWFDRDADGVSDDGEVVTAEEFGIVRLAARSTEVVEGCPAHRAGMTLRDGHVLPTYDWIAEPVAP